jgi:3-hydroxyacyl-CoA dehydrogenase
MKLSQIKNTVVVGSGFMGHGIGQTFALGGYEVTLNDISDALLNKSVQQIRLNLNTFVEFGMTTPQGTKEALSRIKTNRNLKEAAGESDFVVETLSEVMDLKRRIFEQLDEYFPPHAIIATTEPPEILGKKVRRGKLGVKTGEGFFRCTPEEVEKKIKERDRQFLQRLKCLYLQILKNRIAAVRTRSRRKGLRGSAWSGDA